MGSCPLPTPRPTPARRTRSPRCAPGDEVDGVFACTRKDRLIARAGHAVPRARAARPHRRDPGARVPRRRRARRALRARRPRARRAAASSASATSCRSRCARSRAPTASADPAAFLPVAYRDLDELDGFLEHLARRGPRPGATRACSTRCSATTSCAPHWRRAPCTRGGHHAYLGGLLEHTVAVGDARARDVRAAPAPGPGPAAHRRARARPRQDARVHLRRRDRADRRGPAARPRRARAADARRARAARRPRRRAPPRARPLRADPPRRRRRARPALRLARGARAVPPQRARRRASRARSSTGSCWMRRRVGCGDAAERSASVVVRRARTRRRSLGRRAVREAPARRAVPGCEAAAPRIGARPARDAGGRRSAAEVPCDGRQRSAPPCGHRVARLRSSRAASLRAAGRRRGQRLDRAQQRRRA